MCTNDGRINHLQCGVGHAASGERFQHHVPDAAVGPPAKLPKDRVPVAEFLRKVAPRRARSHHPKHGVEHAAMAPRRPPAVMDQERFVIRPLIVCDQSANQSRSPQREALNQFAIPASMGLFGSGAVVQSGAGAGDAVLRTWLTRLHDDLGKLVPSARNGTRVAAADGILPSRFADRLVYLNPADEPVEVGLRLRASDFPDDARRPPSLELDLSVQPHAIAIIPLR